jgi:hypothetical protein
VRVDDFRFLIEYDRWATGRILAAAASLGEAAWPAGEPIGERQLAHLIFFAEERAKAG